MTEKRGKFRRLGTGWLLAGLAALAGCGDSLKTVPVSGKVSVGTKPMSIGLVRYVPDAARGNEGTVIPSGSIDEDGHYELRSRASVGAPVGWYKVVVVTNLPGSNPAEVAKAPRIDPRFHNAEKTPLSIEVTADAPSDHYDLQLTP